MISVSVTLTLQPNLASLRQWASVAAGAPSASQRGHVRAISGSCHDAADVLDLCALTPNPRLRPLQSRQRVQPVLRMPGTSFQTGLIGSPGHETNTAMLE